MESRAVARNGSKRPLDNDTKPSVLGDPEDPWSYHKETVPADVPVRLLPQLVQLANSEDPKDQLQGTLLIRTLLCVSEHPPIDQVVESQAVPRLVSFMLRDDFVDLQLEAAWAVTNVASGTSAHTNYVIEQGAVPHFIRLLNLPSEKTRDHATWALGTVAGDSAVCRDYVLAQGVMAPLLQCITTPAEDTQVLRNGVWAVSNLCRSKPSPDPDTVCQALPAIVPLLTHEDEHVVRDVCWALAYISDGPPAYIERVLNTGALPQIISLLTSDDVSQQIPALRVVGNISAGNEAQRCLLLSCGVLSQLHLPLQHLRRTIKKEACRTLANIVTASEHIQAVIEEGLFPALVQSVSAVQYEVKQEAVQCLANVASHGTAEQIRYVVEELNVFNDLVQVLALYDSEILKIALNALQYLLQAGEDEKERRGLAKNPYHQVFIDIRGFSHLENLESHSNNDISDAADDILVTFFGDTVEESVEDTVPAAAHVQPLDSGYAFGGTDPGAGAGGHQF